jgi:phosphogluconate dehydratase
MIMSTLNNTLQAVTERIVQRSRESRRAYLADIEQARHREPGVKRLGCANVAHAFAAMHPADKARASGLSAIGVLQQRSPNIGIVSAYNDMLSAHAPYQHVPDLLKQEARSLGATAQVAGGVPAMCDGITQGASGMELSLFSRDVIAMSTAVALSHDVFDGALLLGVCDKIVPGLLIGALQFGHLPMVFVPAGPMSTGLSNSEKSKVRQLAATGQVGRETLLQAESQAYHGQGTCTFYGTANSNQMLLEAMGLHVPGAAFIAPGTSLRQDLTREAMRTVLGSHGAACAPIGLLVDERCIVNAMVALLATGGSTNHLIHWVAVARAAGIVIDWGDFSELSDATPLLARVYPNGQADVNQFQAAGGPAYVLRELLGAGLLHPDVLTCHPDGIQAFTRIPSAKGSGQGLQWTPVADSPDATILRPATQPFSPQGGVKLLTGNLGRSVIKVSAVATEHQRVTAPCRVFDSQEAFLAAFAAAELDRDVVCVLRWQGPQANGMPELHKLTPPLSVLQDRGYQVALVTDGRMSGASGKVPAAIHVSPEALAGGPLAKLHDGDVIELDAAAGTLQVLVDAVDWAKRDVQRIPEALQQAHSRGTGRALFAAMRRQVRGAEEGAVSWM